MAADEKRCFVIMPFGVKNDDDDTAIDFDQIYEELFVEPAEAAGLTIVRCDKISRAGSIHEDMFTHIAMDDVVIVDVTTANPNVFYELGVRHALAPSVTVLTRRSGTKSPFDVQGLRIIGYPADNHGWAAARKEIKEFIQNGRRTRHTDSPIFSRFCRTRGRTGGGSESTCSTSTRPNSFVARQVRIAVITGDIRQWSAIDVSVNSENTNMQMARFSLDRSLSAIVRYEGARKDESGEIVEDTVAIELPAAVGGRKPSCPAASTSPARATSRPAAA